MTRAEAYKVAETYVSGLSKRYSAPFVLLDERTREEDFGWVFFYVRREFFETGDMRFAVGGNAPINVDRETGDIHETGTAHAVDYYVEHYRRKRRPA